MRSTESGYSLLEILIALALALFLSAGILGLFWDSQKIYRRIQQVSNVQLHARIAFQFLSHDIRMAGLIGCVRLVDFSPLHADLTSETRLLVWHQGYSHSGLALPPLPGQRADSDVILIQALHPNTFPVRCAKGRSISLVNRSVFHSNDRLLISDCQHAEALYWGRADKLRYTYQQDSEIGFLERVVYYIADTGRRDERHDPIYALYRRDLNKSLKKPAELVEDIVKMSIRVGVRGLETGRLVYVNPLHVKRWSNVHSVEVTLLFNDSGGLQQTWRHIIALRE